MNVITSHFQALSENVLENGTATNGNNTQAGKKKKEGRPRVEESHPLPSPELSDIGGCRLGRQGGGREGGGKGKVGGSGRRVANPACPPVLPGVREGGREKNRKTGKW